MQPEKAEAAQQPAIQSPLPEPPGGRLLGNLKEIKQDFFHTFGKWHDRHGDLVRFRLGPKRYYLLSHPLLAEQVLVRRKQDYGKAYNPEKPRGLSLILGSGLVTSDGDLWQRQRRLIQPMFHKSNIVTMIPLINQACEQMLEQWRRHGAGAGTVQLDMSEQMTRVTLEIITQSMFSCSVQEDLPWLQPGLKFALDFVQRNFFNPLSLPLWVPTPQNIRINRFKKRMSDLVESMINRRLNVGADQHDLLDLLMQAQLPPGTASIDSGDPSVSQIIDEVMTIFNAGHETTANALCWTLHLLSSHPQVLRQLREEVDTVLQQRSPQFEDLGRLNYCEAVIEEAMRIYPPVVSILRRAVVDTEISGHPVEAGDMVFVNIHNIHHHPGLWRQPGQFDPQRFLSPRKAGISKLAYMPFGAGHRVCLGNALALMEAKIILSWLVRSFDFKAVPGRKVEPVLAITLQPKHGLPMFVNAR